MPSKMHIIAAANAEINSVQAVTDVVFVDESGAAIDIAAGSSAYELPAAGKDTLGGVKQYVPEQTIGNVESNIAQAAADAPTKDEFDKLVTAFNTLAEQFDDIIAGLVAAGVVKLPDKK